MCWNINCWFSNQWSALFTSQFTVAKSRKQLWKTACSGSSMLKLIILISKCMHTDFCPWHFQLFHFLLNQSHISLLCMYILPYTKVYMTKISRNLLDINYSISCSYWLFVYVFIQVAVARVECITVMFINKKFDKLVSRCSRLAKKEWKRYT
jgi:hypothetical protein